MGLLGAPWAVMGPSWAVSGPFWGPFGPSWGVLEGLLSCIGESVCRKNEEAAIFHIWSMDNQWLLHIGAFLGVIWETFWGVLEAFSAVLGPCWASWNDRSASRGSVGPSRGPLEALWARLGALLDPKESRGEAGNPRVHARNPNIFGNLGFGPLSMSPGLSD